MLICPPQLKPFAVGPVSSKWQGWSVARSGLHGYQGSDLLGAGRPPMAMNCTTNTHTQSTPATYWSHSNKYAHTETHTLRRTLVVMWVDWSLNKGHGQSQAAQTTSDPEKRPLSNAQSVTVLRQAWFTHAHIHKRTLSLSANNLQVDEQICPLVP